MAKPFPVAGVHRNRTNPIMPNGTISTLRAFVSTSLLIAVRRFYLN